MNSSTGFKKRSILRPPSGIRERQREYLKIFDISQSQPMIANTVRSQLIRIQEEINMLDQDKKIRSGEGSSLQKSYVLTLKRWLRDSLSGHEKQQDDVKIMKYMGVDSYESGFRKLWKVISSFDQMVTKITQLQIIQLLKYDQIFDQLAKDSQKASLILSTMSKAGFTAGTFQVSQVLLQRSKDIYSLLMESKRKGGSLIGNVEKQSSKKQQANQLIAQLQKENSKLSQLLEELEREKENNHRLVKELKNKEEIIKATQNVSTNVAKTTSPTQALSNNPNEAFKQLEDRYTQRMNYLSLQINKLQSSLSQQTIAIGTLQTRAKLAEQDLRQKDVTKGLRLKSGSYEQALVEELQKMKKGFEKKIKGLLEEHGVKEREMRKKEIEYKNENEKVKWEKNLLLKKFQTLQQVKNK